MSRTALRKAPPLGREGKGLGQYELQASQVATPLPVVKFFWQVVREFRENLGSVLDLGAGDGRFARYGHYQRYTGIEIDPDAAAHAELPTESTLKIGCAFAIAKGTYDACIGNPPYLRHHHIESPWKERTLAELNRRLATSLGGHGNLFLYFMALALLRSAEGGLAALLVPFDWASRPSARGLREAIERERWAVTVYRFDAPIFEGVDTTASISIIDKSRRTSDWHTYDVDREFKIRERRGLTGSGKSMLPYMRRGEVYARRGLSPGSQPVFTLTEGERVHHGLRRDDVVPCITTLRQFPDRIGKITAKVFRETFVEAGRRCWLIKTSHAPISPRLKAYIAGVGTIERDTATCRRRESWYQYEKTPIPPILVHSGFSGERPRVVLNEVRAVPVGAMYGVYAPKRLSVTTIQRFLRANKIVDRVVPHSGRLRKVEVGQLNGLLAERWPKRVRK